jgi:aldose 1-epimerase
LSDESMQAEPFGSNAKLYTLRNENLRVRVTDFGGRIVSIEMRNRQGGFDHVALGFDSLEAYSEAGGSFGALLGRNANRIAGGRFTIDGQSFELSRNEGDTTLHGGKAGFGKVFWRVDASARDTLALRHFSPDGDQGFPGDILVRATYRLEGDTLLLTFEAKTTKPTPLSLSAHPYFNLAGPSAGDMLDHEINIAADAFLPTDAKQIPTGEIRDVAGTPFDFRRPMPAGARIREPDPQILYGKGYDHYFVLGTARDGTPQLAARARHAPSGRTLEVFTTQPGTQFYTGNNLNGSVAGRGGAYRQSAGFAFEPQGFPNAVNQPNFPTTVLRPGAKYREVIGYRLILD